MCAKHRVAVDKRHIDECDLLTSRKGRSPNAFRQQIRENDIFDLSQELFQEIKEHFEELQERVDVLVKTKRFLT